MQIGVNILNFGPGASPEGFLRWAKLSEALGYHSLMISDHVAITPSVAQRYPEPFFDCLATLTWLAGQTARIKLGTTVVVLPYRHPVLTARLVADLDRFSGGRFIFGVGVGNAEDEFKVLGQPHARRGLIGDEDLAAMSALWNSKDPVSFHGKLVDFEDVGGIETEQKPHPPIWVGGASSGALTRAARFGQGWHPILFTPGSLDQAQLASLKELSEKQGKPAPAFCPRIRLDITDKPLEGDRLAGNGSLDQVRQDLAELERIGAAHVTLDWYTGDLEATKNHERGFQMLSLLAEQVVDLKREALK